MNEIRLPAPVAQGLNLGLNAPGLTGFAVRLNHHCSDQSARRDVQAAQHSSQQHGTTTSPEFAPSIPRKT
ncbi:hypothetical protein ON010_g9341 [Phytophthora cinnamomi]|nr:hypothetical protein ON010_g9341 [Phytophthora cinnamomi]